MQHQITKGWVLFQVILLITLAQFNSDIFLPSMPAMMLSLQVSIVEIQRVVLYAMIAFGVSLLVWGPISDYYGRRPVAIAGLVIFALGSLFSALAVNLHWLVAGRVLQGVGISCTGALSPVIPKDIFQDKALLKAFSIISMAMAIIPIGAQVLGGVLQSVFSWRANFITLMLYGAFILSILTMYLPETNPNCRKGPMPLKRVLRQYWEVLTDRVFLGLLGCLIFVLTGEMLYTIVSPFWLQMDLGLSAFQNGLLSVFSGAGLFAGAWLSSRLANTKTASALILIGILHLTLSTLLMWTVTSMGWYSVWTLVLPYMLFMVGAGFIYPNAIASIIDRFPDNAGIAGALMSALQMAGAGMMSAALRLWVFTPYHLALFFGVLVILVALSFYVSTDKGNNAELVPGL